MRSQSRKVGNPDRSLLLCRASRFRASTIRCWWVEVLERRPLAPWRELRPGLRMIYDATWHDGKVICFLAASQILVEAPSRIPAQSRILVEAPSRIPGHIPRWLCLTHSPPNSEQKLLV